jgi:nitrogenase-associated protein
MSQNCLFIQFVRNLGTAPRVKSGEVNPEQVDAETALRLLVEDPLLIRRPLLRVGEDYRQGFDPGAIAAWIGLASPTQEDVETCPRSS